MYMYARPKKASPAQGKAYCTYMYYNGGGEEEEDGGGAISIV